MELVGCDALLYSKLTGSTALTALVGNRIYPDLAPDTGKFPMVIYSVQAAVDTLAMGAARVWVPPLYLVKVCGQEDGNKPWGYPQLQPAAKAVDAALTFSEPVAVTVNGVQYLVYGGFREQPIQYAERESGKRTNYLGGLYRFHVQQL